MVESTSYVYRFRTVELDKCFICEIITRFNKPELLSRLEYRGSKIHELSDHRTNLLSPVYTFRQKIS
jgi:hypothetical protein